MIIAQIILGLCISYYAILCPLAYFLEQRKQKKEKKQMDTEKLVKKAFGFALKEVLETTYFNDWFWDYLYGYEDVIAITDSEKEEQFYDLVADIKKEIIKKTLDNLSKSDIIIL